MFAPTGYVPFVSTLAALSEFSDTFWQQVALPAAISAGGKEPDFRRALAGRTLLLDWLIDLCLFQQPVPIYLASPEGRIMRASHQWFVTSNNLSRYQFEWPMEDYSELGSILVQMDAEALFLGSAFYPLLSYGTFCISAEAPDEELLRIGNAKAVEALKKVSCQFDGWAVCLSGADLGELERFITQDSGVIPVSTLPSRRPGRPRKRDEAAAAYKAIFPNGHEADGKQWKEALAAVEIATGTRHDLTTLKRGLAEFGITSMQNTQNQ